MTWTYAGSPGTSTAAGRRDAVRFLVGDTDTNDQQATDEEISFALDQSSDAIYSAAVLVARGIAGKYARLVDTDFDGVSSSYSQRQDHYLNIAARLEREATTKGGGLGSPGVGGISESEMDSAEDDSDRLDPRFKRGQFRNPPDTADDDTTWWDYHH